MMNNNETKVDLTKYPEGPKEIIKYMDYLPENDEERMALLMAFVFKLVTV